MEDNKNRFEVIAGNDEDRYLYFKENDINYDELQKKILNSIYNGNKTEFKKLLTIKIEYVNEFVTQ